MDEELKERVFMALGAASMCWEDINKAGIFKDQDAVIIGDELLSFILENYSPNNKDTKPTRPPPNPTQKIRGSF